MPRPKKRSNFHFGKKSPRRKKRAVRTEAQYVAEVIARALKSAYPDPPRK